MSTNGIETVYNHTKSIYSNPIHIKPYPNLNQNIQTFRSNTYITHNQIKTTTTKKSQKRIQAPICGLQVGCRQVTGGSQAGAIASRLGRGEFAAGKRQVRGWDAAISRLRRDDFAAGSQRFRG